MGFMGQDYQPTYGKDFLSGLGNRSSFMDIPYEDYAKLTIPSLGSGSETYPGSDYTFGQNAGNSFQIQNLPSAQSPSSISFMDKYLPGFLDKTNQKTGMTTQGYGSFGLGALQAGAGFYLGNQQLGLAEDQFAESKRQFGANFGAQVQNYNTDIKDRQDRRYSGAGGSAVANNPYETTATYMDKNRLVG